MKTYILGHRGASGSAPENTKAAFQLALEMGADGVEFDVHMTKDKKLVVIHDEKVDRTTDGTGFVKDMNLEEIKKLDAGKNFSPEFAGERILTLEETLEIVKDCRLINIEVKNGIIFYPNLEKRIIDLIKDFGIEKKVILSSFNHYSIHLIKGLAPELKTGILYMAGLYKPWDYARIVGANAIHPYYLSITSEMIKEAHQHGIEVNVYTVNEKKDLKMVIKEGVDVIMTNYPERALKLNGLSETL